MPDLPSPTSISELFDREPTELSDSDFATIIAYYRNERARIAALEAVGKKPSSKKDVRPKTTADLNNLLDGLL